MGEAASIPPSPRRSPTTVSVSCATCNAPVDPLRAARVAILRERFRYFCSAECREHFDPAGLTPLPEASDPQTASVLRDTEAKSRVRETHEEYALRHQKAEALDDVLEPSPASERLPQATEPELDEAASAPPALVHTDDVVAPADVGSLLLALGLLGGALAVALILSGDSQVALTARAIVAGVACLALCAKHAMGQRDPSELHPVSLLAAPVLSVVLAWVALLGEHPRAPMAITLSALIVSGLALTSILTLRARRPIDAEREQISAALDQTAHRVVGEEMAPARAGDLRPGEEIVVEASETVPVDALISAGQATVLPWLNAKTPITVREGDTVVAGAQVVEGRLRAVVSWAAHDRAWIRLTNDLRRRADLFASLARVGKISASRGAPLAAALAALTAFAANHDLLTILLFATSVHAAIATPCIAQLPALHTARGLLEALRRGIVFRTADALDQASRVTMTAFCARGTLLLGEPEVANIEPLGGYDASEVLALIAGAEAASTHPVATAVLRAARARNVRPDASRSHNTWPGLGVTAVASAGQRLVVGSRALMLKEGIGVASAEGQITEFEAMGRTVLLVALGSRLIGVVGLQDGLRPGARAAVQHLLDVGVEPVLLSGDARETCEAIGRTLDIQHVRPEVPPAERGEQVRRLADGGAIVAVVGQSPMDDGALTASDVSVALSSAGSTTVEWAVQLASDDVRDAAYAIRLAHFTRQEARLSLLLALGPSVVAALAVSFALASPAVAPLIGAAGGIAALLRLRSAAVD